MNVFELINPTTISMYWDSKKADQSTYLGEKLFPATKVIGLELSKIGGRDGVPVQLKASAFDTQATFRDRLGIEMTKTKLPFFRERMKIDEEVRQQILAISNDSILKQYVNRIFDDKMNLLRGARASRERMAMELISTGHVTINGNGVKMDYNYGVSNKQKVKSTTAWTDTANSKPLQDLSDWSDYARTKFHVQMGFAVMTTKTFNLLKASESVVANLYPNSTNQSKMFVSNQQVKDLVQLTTGLTILINDNVYADEVGGASKPFFPDYTISLIPVSGRLGNMTFGTTPEEVDLATNAKTAGNTTIVDTGVAVYTRLIDHPVNVETIVSQIVLPSLGTDMVEDGAGSFIIGKVD